MDQLPPTWWWGGLRSKRVGTGENKGRLALQKQAQVTGPPSQTWGWTGIKLASPAPSPWAHTLQTGFGSVPLIQTAQAVHAWSVEVDTSPPATFPPRSLLGLILGHLTLLLTLLLSPIPVTAPPIAAPMLIFLIKFGFLGLAMVMNLAATGSTHSWYIHVDPCLTSVHQDPLRFWDSLHFWYPKACPSWCLCFSLYLWCSSF